MSHSFILNILNNIVILYIIVRSIWLDFFFFPHFTVDINRLDLSLKHHDIFIIA